MKPRKLGWLAGLLCLVLWPVAACTQQSSWEKQNAAAVRAYQRADFAEAEKLFLAALREAEKFGPQDPRLATSLSNLASLYSAQGR